MKVQKLIHHKQLHKLDISGISLLSREEAGEYLTQEDRTYHDLWWWLRSPGLKQLHVAFVNYDGSIYNCGYVNCDFVFVRPVLTISNISELGYKIGDIFEFGDKQFKIISESLAFCLDDIGRTYFDFESNDYEKSHIKKYIDDWFNEIKKQFETGKGIKYK